MAAFEFFVTIWKWLVFTLFVITLNVTNVLSVIH